MKTKPWEHQQKEYEESLDRRARALFWGMRTGKSKLILDQMSNLYLTSGLNGGLILAPNGVHYNWCAREAKKHIWEETPYQAFPWINSLSNKKSCIGKARFAEQSYNFLESKDFKLLAVNYEALRVPRAQTFIKKFLKSCKGRVYLAADESHHLGRPSSRQSALAKGLAKLCEYVRILSGTPVLESPLQAYSQFNILEPGALGFTRYSDFKKQYAVFKDQKTRKGQRYRALSHYINLEDLQKRLGEWASVVLRSDIPDMPKLLFNQRGCMLSAKQISAYLSMVDYELKQKEVTVTVEEGAARLLKLQQILGGFVYHDNGKVVNIDECPPRLDAVVEEALGTLPGKFIIWCRFTEDIRRVAKRMKQERLRCVNYFGEMRETDKEKSINRFQEDNSVVGFIGQPQSGGEGLDLSAADAIINYGHSHRAIIRNQSCERATEKGGKNIPVIDIYSPGTIEEPILACLEAKEDVADLLSGQGLQVRQLLEATNI